MTPETQLTAAADLRAIALELDTLRARLAAIADTLKDPRRITQPYLDATTAASHAFSAVKAASALASRLDPAGDQPAQPAAQEPQP